MDLARTAGLAKLGVVTVDGSKIRANTSRHKAMSHGFADPNAQMMKTGDGAYAYNAQAAASKDGVIVAAEVTTTVRDIGELVPMADQIEANTGERAGRRLAADDGLGASCSIMPAASRNRRTIPATPSTTDPAAHSPRNVDNLHRGSARRALYIENR